MKKPKRNKRLLMSFLAINTLVTAYTGTNQSLTTTKTDRLYNSIVKNIQTGKTNKGGHHIQTGGRPLFKRSGSNKSPCNTKV